MRGGFIRERSLIERGEWANVLQIFLKLKLIFGAFTNDPATYYF